MILTEAKVRKDGREIQTNFVFTNFWQIKVAWMNNVGGEAELSGPYLLHHQFKKILEVTVSFFCFIQTKFTNMPFL